MEYQKIQGFPAEDSFRFPELRALAAVWHEKKAELEGNGAYQEFIKKLQREWAIETGIIERLYNWDRGVTEVLINQGVEASIISHRGGVSQSRAEDIKTMIDDHLGVVEGLFGYVKGEEPLTEYFIRGLQAQFTSHQDYTDAVTSSGAMIKVALLKGEYKQQPNNPRRGDGEVHEYCPPEFTKDEMESLVSLYREAESSYEPEVKAAWLHHRFTQIHPFQDGNGRVARALASLVFLKAGLFPLVVRDSDREEYIGGLEAADIGDLEPLVNYFARRQREAILRAIGLEQQVQQGGYAGQIIVSALELLKDRLSKETAKLSEVYGYADKLFAIAVEKYREVFAALDKQLVQVTPPNTPRYHARFNSAGNESDQRHYFQKQIVEIANKFDYFANFENYRAWLRATLTTQHDFDYVVSFHGYGFGQSGILSVSAFTYLKAPREEGGTEPVDLRTASTDLFQFNYIESFESSERRFAEWLDSSLAIALAEWKRTL
ncbi:Fic family protein [Pseudomonas tolaasii]|uniref:Fic family protein n=1 Tax=Pseudomonas tolaasii TaxID=29442 RepID=UPI0027333971|nr:Fic family protein [Pseudomonas tolaasii]WLH51223.1 Fic family protein [Pseudomonas tolaasii]